MNKSLCVFGISAVVSAVMAFPLTSQAGWIGHSYASCLPEMDNQSGTTYGYYFQGGSNPGPHEMVLSCAITETTERTKNVFTYLNLKARDYNSWTSVRALACLNSETGSGGGCSALHATTGSTGTIETLSIPQADMTSIWPSASGYAYIQVILPVRDGSKPASSIIGYYYGS
jgi:hypothetical protein